MRYVHPSIYELFTLFPEGKSLHKRRWNKEKKYYGELLDKLSDLRQTSVDNDNLFMTLYLDCWIEAVDNYYQRAKDEISKLKRLEYLPTNNRNLEQAKQHSIADLLGITNTRERINIRCIFHEDKTPSMTVYCTTNRFYCYGCSAWGDSVDVYAKLHDVSIGDAIKALS